MARTGPPQRGLSRRGSPHWSQFSLSLMPQLVHVLYIYIPSVDFINYVRYRPLWL